LRRTVAICSSRDGPGVYGVPRLANLFDLDSPGLTESLALAEHSVTALT
jgi:hypothetical protein